MSFVVFRNYFPPPLSAIIFRTNNKGLYVSKELIHLPQNADVIYECQRGSHSNSELEDKQDIIRSNLLYLKNCRLTVDLHYDLRVSI